METQLWQPNRTEPNRTEIIHDLENNFTKNKILQLKSLFPEAFCEEQIDWEKLKLILGADNLAHQNERYQLNWAGKTDAYRTLQAPTFNTLSPCRAESVDFDGTRNLFIEAENLEALKILQKAYAGSVKMIYIDPPYNTGSDSFIYPDKFSETREEYAKRVGDKDVDGYLKRDGVFQGAWRKNPRENGHYHSNWLSMMLPRLHLARTLLRDDGVIFISIDDNEQAQLKLLCDEVFGAENFFASMVVVRSEGGGLAKKVIKGHDYLLAYTKNMNEFKGIFKPKDIRGKIIIKNDVEYWIEEDWLRKEFGKYGTLLYEEIEEVKGIEKKLEIDKEIQLGNYVLIKKGKGNIVGRLRRVDEDGTKFYSILKHLNKNGENDLKAIHLNDFFDYPKPVSLIKELVQGSSLFSKNEKEIFLDFFSGSGTTAHAVMQLNAEDGGNRRYLCVQLPEDLNISLAQATSNEAKKTIQNAIDFLDSINKERTIAEIAKERIRRAGKQVSGSLKDGQSVDTGFKVFKLAESNFKQWRQPENIADLGTTMEMFVNAVQDNALPENMLYELMLRLGCKLTSPIEHKNGVYWVTDEDTGKRIALLLEAADQTLIDDVIAAAPAKVVALDKWFDGNDALKSNTVLQMKDAGIVFECV